MLFNSLQYLAFFPMVAVVYFVLPFRFRWGFLVLASYYFYMCWRPVYALTIVASTLAGYVGGLLIGNAREEAGRRLHLILSTCVIVGLLFFFKYFNFLNESVRQLAEAYNIPYSIPVLDILLPVGISFHTFQTLSYTIDVFRGVRKPERHLGYFALYVVFFPQLVAGPIERSTRLLPQFFKRYDFDWERARSGLLLMAVGFFKKLVIADRLAIYVNEVYNHPTDYQGLPIILASYFFAFQIFCDFSGYSDIAVGSARVLGYELMENFNRPYASKSVAEFWRRWHISLSTWFRDYLYIPLGGNRVPIHRWYANIMIVFLLSGLWHGANWTFVFWGLLHGAYLIVGSVTAPLRARIVGWLGLERRPSMHAVIKTIITFHLVVFAWVFFRAKSVSDALILIGQAFQGLRLADPNLLKPLDPLSLATVLIALIALECGLFLKSRGTLPSRLFALPLPVRWAAYYVLIFGIIAFGTFDAAPFIYFQF